jgi:hypothetical protein
MPRLFYHAARSSTTEPAGGRHLLRSWERLRMCDRGNEWIPDPISALKRLSFTMHRSSASTYRPTVQSNITSIVFISAFRRQMHICAFTDLFYTNWLTVPSCKQDGQLNKRNTTWSSGPLAAELLASLIGSRAKSTDRCPTSGRIHPAWYIAPAVWAR